METSLNLTETLPQQAMKDRRHFPTPKKIAWV